MLMKSIIVVLTHESAGIAIILVSLWSNIYSFDVFVSTKLTACARNSKPYQTTKKHTEEKDRIFSFSSYQYWLDNRDKCDAEEPEDLKRKNSNILSKNKKRRLSTKKDGIKSEFDDYELG